MIDFTIGKMTDAQIAQVAELEKCCFSDPWPAEILESELDNPLSLWLTAVADGRVIGYVGSQSVLGEADMMNLAVAPDCRRQKVAQKLVETLCSELRAQNVHCLTLEVRASNDPAAALYDKLGFCQVGLRPNYYSHPREDARILRKDLMI